MNVLLAERFPETMDPTGWYMSEKLDGIRAIWDGNNLVSRNGNVFPAPSWFKDRLPKDVKLDGELWLGRKQFDETSSIIRSGSQDKGWNKISYMTFDIPDIKAGVVEERWDKLRVLIRKVNNPQVQVLQQIKCENAAQLMKLLDVVITLGAEGLMLRKPKSYYEGKRSSTLLKLKRFYDAEAKVIGHEPLLSAGKIVPGAVGALNCINDKGIRFEVGTGFTMNQRYNMPAIGSTITYKYQELQKSGKPRFPVYVGVRDYE